MRSPETRADGAPPEAWRNIHVYSGSLDRLLGECVLPFLQNSATGLAKAFFERHYAGGPHARVRFCGTESLAASTARQFKLEALAWLGENRTTAAYLYSDQRAGEMMFAEGQIPAQGELDYRENTAVEFPYQRLEGCPLAPALRDLLESFLQACTPVAAEALSGRTPKLEWALRLYFTHAALITGDQRGGAVAFRAHWEGFASLMKNRKVVKAIRDTYELQRDFVKALLVDVSSAADGSCASWSKLIGDCDRRLAAIPVTDLGFQTVLPHQAKDRTAALRVASVEMSPFFDVLLDAPQFFVEFGRDRTLIRVRVLINLLYCLIANLGLSLIDRMSLCFFAYRAVEDHFGCDLTDDLTRTVRKFTGIERFGK